MASPQARSTLGLQGTPADSSMAEEARMTKVQAMFYVASITKTPSDYITVVLLPVTRNTKSETGEYESPNVDWAKYTPSGKIEMNVSVSLGAAAFFEENLGKDVPLVFG